MEFLAKKANATLHKGAGGSIRRMQSVKKPTFSSFKSGSQEGQKMPLRMENKGNRGDSRKVDKME